LDAEIAEMNAKAERENAVEQAAIERFAAKGRRYCYEEAERRRLKQAQKEYRDLPQSLEEDAIRQRLSLSAHWPEFLDVRVRRVMPSMCIMQAEVFYRFLYNKAHLRYRFAALAPAAYVIERFGVSESSSEAATRTVLDYLNHLPKEAFLNAGALNTTGRFEFIVWHGSPTPPRCDKLPPDESFISIRLRGSPLSRRLLCGEVGGVSAGNPGRGNACLLG
jgi:hypothetical protein